MKPVEKDNAPSVSSLHSPSIPVPELGKATGSPSLTLPLSERFNISQAFRCYNGQFLNIAMNFSFISENSTFDIVVDGIFFANINGQPSEKPTTYNDRINVPYPYSTPNFIKTIPLADGWLTSLKVTIENSVQHSPAPILLTVQIQDSNGRKLSVLLVDIINAANPFPLTFSGIPQIANVLGTWRPFQHHYSSNYNTVNSDYSFQVPTGTCISVNAVHYKVTTSGVAGIRAVSNFGKQYDTLSRLFEVTANQNPSTTVQYEYFTNSPAMANVLPRQYLTSSTTTAGSNDAFHVSIGNSDIADQIFDLILDMDIMFF